MRLYLTAIGLALSSFGVVVRSNRTDLAVIVSVLVFFVILYLEHWRRERERTRRRAQRRLLEKMAAVLRDERLSE